MEGKPGVIGLRREDKNYFERRVALTPSHVRDLVDSGIKVLVQPSNLRCFSDYEFEQAGATITEDISEAQLILGIKEVPISKLLPSRTYMFFSHTIKAQPYNMPLLDALLDKKIRLIDYECIRSSEPPKHRLVAFGKYAGNAGVIDYLQGLGQFLLMKRFSTPFLLQGYSYMYQTVEYAKDQVRHIGQLIASSGLPEALVPFVFGITGTGRVSEGAQEIMSCLGAEFITPNELENFNPGPEAKFKVYCVVFPTNSLYARNSDGGFDRSEYQTHPELYRSVFVEKFARKISVLIHTPYYENKYPRVLTINEMKSLKEEGSKLLGVCDISCDLHGGIEFCNKFTHPQEPFWLYEPLSTRMYKFPSNHVEDSILYHSLDFLPSELPRDASQHFGQALEDFVKVLAWDDHSLPLSESSIPTELKEAVITCHGELTSNYLYIDTLRKNQNAQEKKKHHIDEHIIRVIRETPDLTSDLENLEHGQDLSDASKQAIIKLYQYIST